MSKLFKISFDNNRATIITPEEEHLISSAIDTIDFTAFDVMRTLNYTVIPLYKRIAELEAEVARLDDFLLKLDAPTLIYKCKEASQDDD